MNVNNYTNPSNHKLVIAVEEQIPWLATNSTAILPELEPGPLWIVLNQIEQ
jgi:hypothetical protein